MVSIPRTWEDTMEDAINTALIVLICLPLCGAGVIYLLMF
jgi:hypothetical protein